MRKKLLLTFCLCATCITISAQNNLTWTLNDCIAYATQKNIQLQKSKLIFQESDAELKQAKAALLPSLSMQASQNLQNRPFQQNSATVNGTEVFTSTQNTTSSGNYSLGLSWTLWNGGQNTTNIRMKEMSKAIANLDLNRQSNSLKEEVAKIYIQILYANEAVKLNQQTYETSKAAYLRGKELLELGSISKVELAQLESQAENDQYNIVVAQSTLSSYKLQLKQLLELDGSEEMQLVMPVITDEQALESLPTVAQVYETALLSRPEIQSSKLSIDNAQLSIRSAKAGFYPTLSLNGSTGTTTNSSSPYSWGSQLKNGWSNLIGLTLSIPIFDNRRNKTNVEKAQIQYATSQLDYQSQQKELYSTIESLWLDANNAQAKLKAVESTLKSNQNSFDLVNEQFRLGMKNAVELLTEKNNLYNAQQQKMQAKYMALLNRTLLLFYENQEIKI